MTADTDHLRAALADLMRWIAAERLEATVIGGVAAGLQGHPRLTEDVDAVIFDADANGLLASGKRHGFEPRIADALEFSRHTRVLLMRHRSGVDVDLSLGALPFEREVIERAQTIATAGLQISIATPEDLIIMKALARRPQDVADIAGIIEVQPHLDVERIRRWVREFSAVLEMPEILDELELLLRRRKL
jgi:predicted nucleotidyltransferase